MFLNIIKTEERYQNIFIPFGIFSDYEEFYKRWMSDFVTIHQSLRYAQGKAEILSVP